MSFSKTVSVVAALASIFAAAATGWKLADTQKEVPLSSLDQKVMELEKKLEEVKEPQVAPDSGVQQPITPPVPVLPQPITPVPQVVQPPLTPPPPVPELPIQR
jgi:hypothetical protein